MQDDLKETILTLTERGKHVFECYDLKIKGNQFNPINPNDYNPSLSVYFNNKANRYYFKDWGEGEDMSGDCFEFVKKLYKCSFQEVFPIIIRDLNLHEDAEQNHIQLWNKLASTEVEILKQSKNGRIIFDKYEIETIINDEGIAIFPRETLWEPEVDAITYTALLNGCSLEVACQKIIKEFKLLINFEKRAIQEVQKNNRSPILIYECPNKWAKYAADFWQKHGHGDGSILKLYNVLFLEYFIKWSNDKKCWFKIKSTPNDPIFAYPLTASYFKIYRPFNVKYKHSHWGINPHRQSLFGFAQLPDFCDQVIITSSPKDVLSLALLGYYAVCMNSETDSLSEYNLELLLTKVSSPQDIYVLFDEDDTGREKSKTLADKHQFTVIEEFIPSDLSFNNGKKVKDVSDWLLYENN
jgi:hypothetical protein